MTALKAKVSAIKGINLYDLVQAVEMCLVPNIVVPKKLQVPEFTEYARTQCPMTHLKSYYNKIIEVVHDKKLLMHFF